MFFLTATLSQCEDSGTFKNMDGDVEKGYFISGCGSINSHTPLQNNGFNSLIILMLVILRKLIPIYRMDM